mmetsp:Transcript_768/g.1660  ORF Transcript_768/g.1660 Transcript_768/m.1660 type:complete len:208 (-) Transcript_768:1457-2080(-)
MSKDDDSKVNDISLGSSEGEFGEGAPFTTDGMACCFRSERDTLSKRPELYSLSGGEIVPSLDAVGGESRAEVSDPPASVLLLEEGFRGTFPLSRGPDAKLWRIGTAADCLESTFFRRCSASRSRFGYLSRLWDNLETISFNVSAHSHLLRKSAEMLDGRVEMESLESLLDDISKDDMVDSERTSCFGEGVVAFVGGFLAVEDDNADL